MLLAPAAAPAIEEFWHCKGSAARRDDVRRSPGGSRDGEGRSFGQERGSRYEPGSSSRYGDRESPAIRSERAARPEPKSGFGEQNSAYDYSPKPDGLNRAQRRAETFGSPASSSSDRHKSGFGDREPTQCQGRRRFGGNTGRSSYRDERSYQRAPERASSRAPERFSESDRAIRSLARGGSATHSAFRYDLHNEPDRGSTDARFMNRQDRPARSPTNGYRQQNFEGQSSRSVGDSSWARERNSERPSRQSTGSSTEYGSATETPQEVEESVPGYTTAASNFLYGQRSILAALKAQKRKLYTLYFNADRGRGNAETQEIKDLAAAARVPTRALSQQALDILVQRTSRQAGETVTPISDGICLEASPFPELSVRHLGYFNDHKHAYGIALEPQSREEEEITGSPRELHTNQGMRNPFLLWLHGTVDVRNVGAIMRTCLYFGVDVILSRRGTASGAGLLRTSTGASEFSNILRVGNEDEFIKLSKEKGWKFYSAVAPGPVPVSTISLTNSPLAEHPCVLVMGNEDEGLPKQFIKLTDGGVTVGGRTKAAELAGVDSLNVSIAAALLIQQFTRGLTRNAQEERKQRRKEKLF